MARINIEDSLFKDNRFTDLCIRLGSRHAALGAFMEACILAQKHYLTTDNDRLIPLIEWQRNPILDHVSAVGLAEIRASGVYVSGSEKQFAWLVQRSEAGKKPKASRGKRPLTTVKRNETKPNGSKAPTLTPTLSSFSYSDSSSEKVTTPQAAPDPELNRSIWSAYSTAYFSRYGTEPVRNAKINGMVAQLAKRLGNEAPDVAAFYLGHGKAFYVAKAHDFGLLLADAEALRTQWATGHKITNRIASQSDDKATLNDQLQRIREGKL